MEVAIVVDASQKRRGAGAIACSQKESFSAGTSRDLVCTAIDCMHVH